MIKPKAKHVLRALSQTIAKLRKEIEALQEKGLSPADYSLGFTNGLIFVEHNLKGKAGRAVFYSQKTSVGQLPVPVKFQHEAEEDAANASEFDAKVENIIDAARKAVDSLATDHASHVGSLRSELAAYDAFMARIEAKQSPPGASPAVESTEISDVEDPRVDSQRSEDLSHSEPSVLPDAGGHEPTDLGVHLNGASKLGDCGSEERNCKSASDPGADAREMGTV